MNLDRFDVVIKDGSGNRVHQYQMKYGATAEDTIRMLKDGNYSNQTLVVPEDQVATVQEAFPNKTVTSTISEGNVSSKPLTKEEAKRLQEEAQKGNFLETDWSEYAAKDIAHGIANEVGKSCLMGAAVGAGMNVLSKVVQGEPIDGAEVVETAIVFGADFGVKTAVAGGLKVASAKGAALGAMVGSHNRNAAPFNRGTAFFEFRFSFLLQIRWEQ